jgi:hypothetical protein
MQLINRTVIFSILFLAGNISLAQDFTLTASASVSGLNTDFELVAKGRISNTSTDSVFRWVRTSKTLTSGWESSVCDTNACYFPQVDSAEVTIPPGKTSKLDMYFYPDGIAGQGQVEVKLFLVSNRAQFVTAVYSGVAEVNSVKIRQNESSIKVYPNPTKDELQVHANKHSGTILIIDKKGKLLIRQQMSGQSSTVNIQKLRPGLYELQVVENGFVKGVSAFIKD